MSQCHNMGRYKNVTILPEGGLVSCGGSQQCHTPGQEDGCDGLTPGEAFDSGDYHDHDDGDGVGDGDGDGDGDEDNK